ncbi:hypothetical protein TNIN_400601 [Trichonephila inaurata madagascariensis]|uniref:Uncharacterized protein n=1 Tax=Trichonephila inaurata madagascariensis TaxID=2747483 RepID=A0A8X7BUG5_9ARAC|nr:hypothetical protein TNIN_400601 [Trichonephila inaurata madagascariensis]
MRSHSFPSSVSPDNKDHAAVSTVASLNSVSIQIKPEDDPVKQVLKSSVICAANCYVIPQIQSCLSSDHIDYDPFSDVTHPIWVTIPDSSGAIGRDSIPTNEDLENAVVFGIGHPRH